MDEQEKQKIKRAIKYLGNDMWDEGMDILLELVGREPIQFDDAEILNITDIMRKDYEN